MIGISFLKIVMYSTVQKYTSQQTSLVVYDVKRWTTTTSSPWNRDEIDLDFKPKT